jgi:hypothetical protein
MRWPDAWLCADRAAIPQHFRGDAIVKKISRGVKINKTRRSKAAAPKPTKPPTTTTKSVDREPTMTKSVDRETKRDQVIAMLKRAEGASNDEISKAMNWLPHTTRSFVTATVGKKLGHPLSSVKDEQRGRVYRIISQ